MHTVFAQHAEENQCVLSLHNMQRRNIISLSLHTKVPHLKLIYNGPTVDFNTMPGKTIIMPMTVHTKYYI